MNRHLPAAALAALVLLLGACGTEPEVPAPTAEVLSEGAPVAPEKDADADAVAGSGFEAAPGAADATAPATDGKAPVQADATPADAFFASIAALCGQAFAGQVEVDQPPSDDDTFAGKPLVMHVRTCSDDALRIPFHVGDDHSRTWVLTRSDTGLRLKHDHRHEDGTPDAVTQYGGDTAAVGSAQRQEFPVDAESVATFEKEGLSASTTNVWAMEIEPGRHFAYELARPGGRLFRVVFDLTTPVPAPPAPWGAE